MEDARFEIRRAGPDDRDLIAEFGARAFHDTFAADNTPEDMARYLDVAFSTETIAAELSDPTSAFLLADSLLADSLLADSLLADSLLADGPDATIGYARIVSSDVPDCTRGERPVELHRLYARSDRIGTGVGAALLERCLRLAREAGYDSMWLGVWERNPRAQAFYRRWEFEVVGSHEFLLGSDRQTDLIMERGLYLPQSASPC